MRTPLVEEVCSEEAVEIDENHNVHEHHGHQEVESMIQRRVVMDEVPGEVKLCSKPEGHVGHHVQQFVNGVDERVLGHLSQFEQ